MKGILLRKEFLVIKDKLNAIVTEVSGDGNIGHKDLFMTKGIETTAGSNVLKGFRPQYSSTVVERLEKAGYKTKAKLNCDAWAHGSSGENSDFGPTLNPWDKERTAGGSCSGSGAAIISGYCQYATGTDTGGSIRLPASFTNITALKPTYGALSRYGVIAMASSLDCPGLFARSVKEIEQLFKSSSGMDQNDATSQSDKRHLQICKTSLSDLKIGVPGEYFGDGLDEEIKQKVMEAIELLKKQGATIKKVSLPYTKYGIAVYYLIQTTEVASNLARYDGIRYGKDRSYFGEEAKRRIILGTFSSSAGYTEKYYEKAAKVRTLLIEDFKKVFNEVDVLIAPVSPTLPFKLGEKSNDPLQMYLSDVLTVNMNLAGIPSLALPCGFSKNNLPIGMQIIGPRWSEKLLFQIGEQYQKLTDWHTRRPDGK